MDASLHSRTIGKGPDLVLVHGWGMHSGIWEEFATDLASEARVTLVDLPGHGLSRMAVGEYSLDALAQQVAQHAPQAALWCGWSLGAQVCLQAALRMPQRLAGVMAVAGTPRFVAGSDWNAGVERDVLEAFATDLLADYSSTLRRFLTLQVRGSRDASQVLRRLRRRILEAATPDERALVGGLHVLAQTDLRPVLRKLVIPSLWILGERDTLVPARLGDEIAVLSPDAQVQVIPGAGHAPFLSHAAQCRQLIMDFRSRILGE